MVADFYWGEQLLACFEDLRPPFVQLDPPVVDREVLPHFDGRADDMFIWFICEKAADVERAKRNCNLLQASIQQRMAARGFPQTAIDSLQSDVTSLEDIEAGGGRFYYFR